MKKGKELNAYFFGGRFDGQVVTHNELIEIGNGKFTEDLTEVRNNGGWVHREELDNQPKVDGYVGPMYDVDYWTKEPHLRYETQEVYDKLSR